MKLNEITTPQSKKTIQSLNIDYGIHHTPFGDCLFAVDKKMICCIEFIQDNAPEKSILFLQQKYRGANICHEPTNTKWLANIIFSDSMPTNLEMLLLGTPFQIHVWRALLTIPFGQVTFYEAIANKIDNPKAIRAVGTAIGQNPISFLVPCHRVIRKSGGLGGYRCGLDRKQALLNWENAQSSKKLKAA